jgi:hypothetical protein
VWRGDYDKFDEALKDRLRAGDPSFRVLLKIRPGAERIVHDTLPRNGRAPLTFASLNTIAADVDARTLDRLAADPNIERISSDAIVRSSAIAWTSTTPVTTDNRLVRSLGMDYWLPNGKGVVVAVIDSGVVANSDYRAWPSTISCPERHARSRGAISTSTITVMDHTSRV